MSHRLRLTLLVVITLPACGSPTPVDGGMDLGPPSDLPAAADWEVLPDLPLQVDLAVTPELASVGDLGALPDLAPAADLARASDLAAVADLTARSDLGTGPDLAPPPDLVLSPDLAPPPNKIVRQPYEHGWTVGPTRGGGVVDFIAGPAKAPLGSGSLRLASLLNADKATLTRLGDHGPLVEFIASFKWRKSGGGQTAPGFKLLIDTTDANPPSTSYDKTLIYEPYQDGKVKLSDDVWSSELMDPDQGGFWLIDYTKDPPERLQSPIRTIKEWAVQRAALAAGVVVGIEIGAGSGNPGLDSFIDDVVLDYRAQGGRLRERFDFEEYAADVTVRKLGDYGWESGDSRAGGALSFGPGPGMPPLGKGSLALLAVDGKDKATLDKVGLATPLSGLSTEYSWYRKAGGPGAPALRIAVDTSDKNSGTYPHEALFDKLLIYEPYLNHNTVDTTWSSESIDPMRGRLWLSDIGGAGPLPNTQKTLAEWLVDPTYGPRLAAGTVVSLQLGVGTGNPGLDAHVDRLNYTCSPWLNASPRPTRIDFE